MEYISDKEMYVFQFPELPFSRNKHWMINCKIPVPV